VPTFSLSPRKLPRPQNFIQDKVKSTGETETIAVNTLEMLTDDNIV